MFFSTPLSGAVHMAGAAASDMARAVDVLGLLGDDERPRDDPFAHRDPDYIRATLPALRVFSRAYFRSEVSGLEHIPENEPVLLVGNHSGGTLIADTFVFAQAFYDHFGPDHPFHQLAHDLVFKVPGAREMVRRYGTVPASPDNMRRALELGAPLLVYPGGDHESYRPTWESDKVDFAGRTGFVRLALELGVRIVPVVAIGGQETALFLGRGRGVASALGIDRALRLKVLPLQFAPPFGFTVLDLPGRIPLPAKIQIQVLEPIDLREELGAKPDPADGYELITDAMQETLTDLSEARAVPVLG